MIPENSVSVITPVYNGENFLGEAIESLLQQTVKPFEIIVIDDGSTDGTRRVANKFKGRIQYVYQKNSGVAAARNKALELARGSLIGFLDADDIWVKHKLEMQLELLRNNPEYDMVMGLLCRIPFSMTKDILQQENVKGEYAIQLGCALLKKQLFEKIGIFDEQMMQGEDVDLFLRILESGIKVWVHKDVVQFYRQHDQNITLNTQLKKYYLLKAYKKSLDRRRKSGHGKIGDLPKLGNIEEVINYWQSH